MALWMINLQMASDIAHFTLQQKFSNLKKETFTAKIRLYRLEMHLLSHKLISTKQNINQVAFIILANP